MFPFTLNQNDCSWTPDNDLHKLLDVQSILMYYSVVANS